jgi:hypothetical protein
MRLEVFPPKRKVTVAKRTGVLVIRAWLEDGSEQDALRVRITETLDISTADRVERAAASGEDVLKTVGDWLRAFVEVPSTPRKSA